MSEACYDDPHPCELPHFSSRWIFSGGFDSATSIILVASSHVGPEGQPPIRSRNRPWGVIDASSAQYSKLLHDNRTAEISTWFAEQSLLREDPRTALIYIFPEDVGGISQRARLLCGHCKSCAPYTVHMTLYEARHFYVVSLDQTGENRWAYSQIFQDYKKPFRWDFRTSRYTGLFFNTTDHCRNHAAVRRLTHPVSEFPLQLVFSRSSPLALHSGNFVFLVYGVRWFSPRYGRRQCGLTGCLSFPDFLSPSPGQKFIVAGNATNSPVSSCSLHGITRPGLIFYLYALGSDSMFRRYYSICIAEFDCTILFIESDEIVLAIHRYFLTTFWSYGRSS